MGSFYLTKCMHPWLFYYFCSCMLIRHPWHGLQGRRGWRRWQGIDWGGGGWRFTNIQTFDVFGASNLFRCLSMSLVYWALLTMAKVHCNSSAANWLILINQLIINEYLIHVLTYQTISPTVCSISILCNLKINKQILKKGGLGWIICS